MSRLLSGGFVLATTETDGKWSKSGLKCLDRDPSKQGWAFDPLTQQVRAADNVNFVG